MSKNLELKIRSFLEYKHQEEKNGMHRGENILTSLSKNLIDQVNCESYINYLLNIKIFEENFSQELLKNLAFKIKEISVPINEFIINVENLYYKF